MVFRPRGGLRQTPEHSWADSLAFYSFRCRWASNQLEDSMFNANLMIPSCFTKSIK